MQCRECGFTMEPMAPYCPACGARQESVPVRPAAPVPPGVTLATPPPPRATAVRTAPSVEIEAPGRAEPVPRNFLPQAGETFAGRYRIEKFLGQGSLCNTFLTRDLGTGNREVVLKIMHPRKAAEPGLAESFLFLAESVARYDHKGIAKVFEAGTHAGAPYYTMEWVSGVPLRMWLLERLTFENRVLPGVGVIRSLLEIFAAIHEHGCYGSLKTENVFLTLNGPVVMDFGVVGFLSSQEFEFNSYARRYLPYMAPEIRQDWSNLIPQSDYYSLGAILYEVLVGRPPMPQLQLPSEMSDLFGIETDEIVLKAMASRAQDRFGTLEAFHQAVDSLQAMLLQARPAASKEAAHAFGDGVEPGLDESQPFQSHLISTSEAHTVHNPDESFATDVFGEADSQVVNRANPGFPWAGQPEEPGNAGGGASESEGEPALDPDQQTISAFAEESSRESEKAHSQRRFAHPQVLPEVAPNAEASSALASLRETDEIPLQEGWESLPGSPQAHLDEIRAAPVPAWLWILLALTGSCLVVLSAYLGLFLPR